MPHRVVFMGTPQFAIPTLKWLIDEYSSTGGNAEVVGVFTQPDRPKGRGRKLEPSPVKMLAQEHGLHVLEPESLRTPETLAELRALQPDVIIVAAFGQILPVSVLELPCFRAGGERPRWLPRYWPAMISPVSLSCRWMLGWILVLF
jgi:methionyl-tRNA formyltransferase